MSENFILAAFRKLGEDPIGVKLMRNKYTGDAAGYCFVSFKNDEAAMDAMHKLNGKPIPGTNPVVRFRLNNATQSTTKLVANDREFSVWVGDLSSDVDDYSLYRVFSAKYSSIKTAKVILDSSGFSKGYGFVKFGLEDEQQDALYKMNGFIGLGSKQLKICNAVPKPKDGVMGFPTAAQVMSSMGGYEFAQYYDPSAYWQNYNTQGYYHNQSQIDMSAYQHYMPETVQEDDDLALVDHKAPVDADKLNNEANERDCNLWDALERSKWLPIEQLEVSAT